MGLGGRERLRWARVGVDGPGEDKRFEGRLRGCERRDERLRLPLFAEGVDLLWRRAAQEASLEKTPVQPQARQLAQPVEATASLRTRSVSGFF